MDEAKLRSLLARRSLRHPLSPHFKATPSARSVSGKTRARSSIYHH
jgi:hypothetical protein